MVGENHHNRPAAFWRAEVGLANDGDDVGVGQVVVAAVVETGDVVDVDDVAGRCFAGVEHDVQVELVLLACLAQYL